MTEDLFQRIVLPVASVSDARTTCKSVFPRLRDDDGDVLAVHVIEKAGGAPDKASVEQREERGREIFAVVEEILGDAGIDVETELLYGEDVAETILDAAEEFDASAIVYSPRGGSRWLKLLAGDTATGIINNTDYPVVILPEADEGGDEDEGKDRNADEGEGGDEDESEDEDKDDNEAKNA